MCFVLASSSDLLFPSRFQRPSAGIQILTISYASDPPCFPFPLRDCFCSFRGGRILQPRPPLPAPICVQLSLFHLYRVRPPLGNRWPPNESSFLLPFSKFNILRRESFPISPGYVCPVFYAPQTPITTLPCPNLPCPSVVTVSVTVFSYEDETGSLSMAALYSLDPFLLFFPPIIPFVPYPPRKFGSKPLRYFISPLFTPGPQFPKCHCVTRLCCGHPHNAGPRFTYRTQPLFQITVSR